MAPRTETMDKAEQTKLLNASGFPFQLAIEDAVRRSDQSEAWQVTGREHPWNSSDGSGYIDLVLTRARVHLVIECKRSRDAAWLFLMPEPQQMERSHARILWTDTEPHRRPLQGWGDIQVRPGSPEAEFCAIRGQGEKGTPLLERLASGVVASSEGLAAQLNVLDYQYSRHNILLPVIVTSAKLYVGKFSPADVNLTAGELDDASFEEVSHVRFRKSLSGVEVPTEFEPESLEDLAYGSVRTVFVVEAASFVEWLRTLRTEWAEGSSPWVNARSAEMA